MSKKSVAKHCEWGGMAGPVAKVVVPYEEFVKRKKTLIRPMGIEIDRDNLNTRLFNWQADIVHWALRRGRAAVFASCGLGKAQAVTEPVLTPQGWVPIGNLKVGDAIIGSDGRSHLVAGVFPQGKRKLFDVTFTDRSTVICDGDHLWTVFTQQLLYCNRSPRVLKTTEILAEGLKDDGGRKRHFLPLVEPIQFDTSSKALPLDAYTLGVFIGDGSLFNTPTISKPDEDLIASLVLPETVNAVIRPRANKSDCPTWGFPGGTYSNTTNPLTSIFRELGLFGLHSYKKFVPKQYLFAPPEDRLAILQGLLDTDGYAVNSTIEFCSSSRQLTDDVIWLARSLGGVANETSAQAAYSVTNGVRKQCHDKFRTCIKLPYGIPAFRLERKAQAYNPIQRKHPKKAIVSITPRRGREDAVCIKTTAPDSLYVTNGFTLTHNTLIQLEWANNIWKHTQAPVVIHCPIGIRQQTKLEAAKFKVKAPIAIVDEQSDLIDGLNLINYEKCHKFDFSQCSGVVLDECFSPNTLIDVLENGILIKKPIKEINVGQVILNSTGRDRVTKTHKRPITKAIRISIEGHWITSSEHHPYFTQRGWVQAADLVVGDYLVKTSTAMCLVSGRVQTHRLEVPFLRKILLSEMANEADRDLGQSTQPSSCKNTRIEEECLVQNTSSRKRDRAYSGVESHGRSQSTSKSESHTEGNETQTISSWREWDGIDSASDSSIGSAAQRMDSRVCVLIGSSQEGLSFPLQNRLGKSQEEIGDRGGWPFTLCEERSRPEKDEDAEFVRVDHTEILEQGHPELERWREADGIVYFYDLTAERHPSYSVAGCLVHNSSILKSLDGKTQVLLTDVWAHAHYRLPCTATPAPNDHMELGNHAEFLGVCNSIDMLSKYFVHDSGDTSKWRLRKHAVKEFWRWVSSWAVCISKPSDIGGSDEGFDLPELKIHRHYVDVPDREPPKRTFFHTTSMSATNIHTERKMTNRSRCEQAVEIARKVKDYCIIWCDTNYEADLLKSLLPEAVEIRGQESDRAKEEKLSGFSNGDYKILISKPSIAGFGMNWQHCNQMVFAGLSFSFERLYQAIRRCYRFGQERPVHVHVILADTDTAVSSAIARKAADFDLMQAGMAEAMREGTMEEFGRDIAKTHSEKREQIELPNWI